MSDTATAPVATETAAPVTTETAPPAVAETAQGAAGAPAEGTAPETAEAKEPPKEREPEAKDFIELKRAKREVFQERQRVKQKESQVAAKEQELEQVRSRLSPVAQALEKFDDDPIAALTAIAAARGKSAQEVFDAIVLAAARQGEAPDPNDRVSKLEAKLREKEEAEAKRAEDEQKAAMERANAERKAEFDQQLGKFIAAHSDDFERVLARGERAHDDLLKMAEGGVGEFLQERAATFARRGEKAHNDLILLVEQWQDKAEGPLGVVPALELLESLYVVEDEDDLTNRYRPSKKLAKYFQPEPASAPAVPAQTADASKAAETPTKEAAQPATSGEPTKTAPRVIPASRAVVPAGSKVIRKPSSDAERMERWAKSVKFV